MEFNSFDQASFVYPGTSELKQSLLSDAVSTNPWEFPSLNATRSGSGSAPILESELEPINLTIIDPSIFIAENFGYKVQELSTVLTNQSDSPSGATDSLTEDSLGVNTEAAVSWQPASDGLSMPSEATSVAEENLTQLSEGEILPTLVKGDTKTGTAEGQAKDTTDTDTFDGQADMAVASAGTGFSEEILPTVTPMILQDSNGNQVSLLRGNDNYNQTVHIAINGQYIGQYSIPSDLGGIGIQVQTKLQFRYETWMGSVRQVQKVVPFVQWGNGWTQVQ